MTLIPAATVRSTSPSRMAESAYPPLPATEWAAGDALPVLNLNAKGSES